MRALSHIRLGIVCAACLLPGTAFAQANYDGVKLGGRTSIMGGAGVARGSDGATAFINPAGVVRIPGESFTFGTFAVEAGGRSVQDFLNPAQRIELKNADANSLNVRVLPNTFCLFLDGPPKDHYSGRSRHKYGVCGADTEQEEFFFTKNSAEQQGAAVVAASDSTRMKWARSSLALAWGFEIQRGLSIGVTARAENARLEDQTNATALANWGDKADMQTLSRSLQASSWDAYVVLGVQYQASRFLTMGASLSTPSQHILGFYVGNASFSPVSGAKKVLVQDDGDFRYNVPSNLRLGLAFSWPRVNFEINGSYYGAQAELAQALFSRKVFGTQSGALTDLLTGRGSLTERGKPVVNFLAGAEFFVEPDFSVLAGVQTDFSGLAELPSQSPANTIFRQQKDAIYASLGAATYGKGGSLLLGLKGFLAKGTVLVADAAEANPQFSPMAQQEWGLSLVVSGQITFEAVRDTAIRAASPLSKIPSALEREDESVSKTAPSKKKPEVNPYDSEDEP